MPEVSKILARCLGLALLLLSAPAARAESYPTRPVRMVVSFPPGGQTDVVARVVAEALAPRLGVPVLVENRPGAAGNTGTDQVARSAPDGYTLVVAAINIFGANPSLFRSMPYDPVRDFAPIVHLVSSPNVLVVGANSPYRSLPELLAAARAQPGRLTFGTAGAGSSMFLFLELLKGMAGVDILHVPYRGSALASTDAIAGNVSMVFDSLPGAIGQIRGGQLRALAVSPAARIEVLPNVPTVAEAGVPGFDQESWLGLAAPARTPAAVVERLNAETNGALRDSAVRARLADMGTRPVGGTAAEFGAFVARQVATWREVVQRAGYRPE
jgi:tripartite-type tricarboxylate transporter receptor subunit TctC